MSAPESAPPSRGAVAAAEQDLSDAEFAELDDLLAAIPEPLEPLDVVMLDGFLCGVIVQPELLAVDAWLPYVFDAGGHRWGEAAPAAEQLRARALILRRYAALNRAIAEFGVFDPFVLEPLASEPEAGDEPGGAVAATPPADGDDSAAAGNEPGTASDRVSPADAIGPVLLPWVAGFEQALQLLPGLAELEEPEIAITLARLFRFLPESDDAAEGTAEVVARERPLGSLAEAIDEVVACVAELYAWTAPLRYKVEAVRRDAPKVGRNDPCPCGSGKKFKQCHGAVVAPKA